MPRSRKRHHSRSRSKTRSRSHSPERNHDKKKVNSHEKDGKRRRVDDMGDSPTKRSLSSNGDLVASQDGTDCPISYYDGPSTSKSVENDHHDFEIKDFSVMLDNQMDKMNNSNPNTPKKPLTPKQLHKKLESEKKRQQKLREREQREKQRQDEKAKLIAEKQRAKEQKEADKLKQAELKQKEKELKEEQKRKEREEKELKRKEKEEQDAQKRQRKIQEIEEKNKEKLKEEVKKQKSAALFKNFFKKSENIDQENKLDKGVYNFMPFEVKSDMKLPPSRRSRLTSDQLNRLDTALTNQNSDMLYLQEIKDGEFIPGKSNKTWPYQEDDITIVEDEREFGEEICEDKVQKMRVKFLLFHENRRPAYYGTWRKKSNLIKPRNPFGQDSDYLNYDEESDDDWEDEEQGESLDMSDDEKDGTNDEDEYEVDNDFFVPHGHLSEDELEEADVPLSPEALKHKLKLLKDEFEEDMKSKTHKLKPRSIGCVWINKQCDNIEDAIYRYLQPFAFICRDPVEINLNFHCVETKKTKPKTRIKTKVSKVNEAGKNIVTISD